MLLGREQRIKFKISAGKRVHHSSYLFQENKGKLKRKQGRERERERERERGRERERCIDVDKNLIRT